MVVTTWPFTGRETEIAALSATLSGGRSAGIVISGPAGAGKTRLAREALDRRRRSGSAVAWAAATQSSVGLPFGAFAHLLGDDLEGRAARDPMAALLAAMDTLSRYSRGRRVVLGVDDAHLLDDLSATFIHQLVLSEKVSVVLTLRRGVPALQAIVALWKDDLAPLLELEPLSAEATGALLARALGGPVESLTVERLWRKTAGNLLFLRELVDSEVRAGRLRCDDRVWTWRGDLKPAEGLVAAVESRMRGVAEVERRLMELLAFGEPLPLRACEELAGEAVVRSVEGQGLVRVEGGGPGGLRVSLAHPLYAEVLRDRIPRLRARSVKADLVQRLAAGNHSSRMDVLRLAVLAVDGEAGPLEVDRLVQAARLAHEMLDHRLAERLARAAVAAGGGFESRLVLAYALSFQGRIIEADDLLRELAREARTDAERVAVAVPLAADQFYGLARPVEGEALLLEAIGRVADEQVGLDLAAVLASMRWNTGRVGQAVEMIDRVLAHPAASASAVAWAAAVGAFAVGEVGRADEVPAIAGRGTSAVALSSELIQLRFVTSLGDVVTAARAGYIHRAAATAGRHHDEARQFQLGVMTSHSGLLSGEAALAAGMLRTAARWLREAIAGAAGYDPGTYMQPMAASRLAQALAMSGEPAAARAALDSVRLRPPCAVHRTAQLLAKAWVVAAEGDLPGAVPLAHEAAAAAAEMGQSAVEILALHDAVRLSAGLAQPGQPVGLAQPGQPAAGVVERLAALAGLDGPMPPLAAEHAAAAAAGDGQRLEQVARQFESIGAILLAADATALASLAYRHGGARVGGLAAMRAAALAERCEGAQTPALRAAADAYPLSEREREIALLTADGATNAEIAQRLVISVRTVENHLHRCYTKLALTGRQELQTLRNHSHRLHQAG